MKRHTKIPPVYNRKDIPLVMIFIFITIAVITAIIAKQF